MQLNERSARLSVEPTWRALPCWLYADAGGGEPGGARSGVSIHALQAAQLAWLHEDEQWRQQLTTAGIVRTRGRHCHRRPCADIYIDHVPQLLQEGEGGERGRVRAVQAFEVGLFQLSPCRESVQRIPLCVCAGIHLDTGDGVEWVQRDWSASTTGGRNTQGIRASVGHTCRSMVSHNSCTSAAPPSSNTRCQQQGLVGQGAPIHTARVGARCWAGTPYETLLVQYRYASRVGLGAEVPVERCAVMQRVGVSARRKGAMGGDG
jgi:hypothetical protein